MSATGHDIQRGFNAILEQKKKKKEGEGRRRKAESIHCCFPKGASGVLRLFLFLRLPASPGWSAHALSSSSHDASSSSTNVVERPASAPESRRNLRILAWETWVRRTEEVGRRVDGRTRRAFSLLCQKKRVVGIAWRKKHRLSRVPNNMRGGASTTFLSTLDRKRWFRVRAVYETAGYS